MMKRIIISLLLIVISLTGCVEDRETIEGYWMSEEGKTISFNSDGEVIRDGLVLDYSIYNENNLSIALSGFAEEYKYVVRNDTLELTNLYDDSTIIFYRDEKKQREIKQKVNQEAMLQEKSNDEMNSRDSILVSDFTETYKEYKNVRYGYKVLYPEILIPQEESVNGDGRKFISSNGEVSLVVCGSKAPMLLEDISTLDEFYVYTQSSLDYIPTYAVKDKNFFVFSGTKEGKIIYQKHILKSDQTENILRIEYPEKMKEEMDEVVTYISKSFISGVGFDSECQE